MKYFPWMKRNEKVILDTSSYQSLLKFPVQFLPNYVKLHFKLIESIHMPFTVYEELKDDLNFVRGKSIRSISKIKKQHNKVFEDFRSNILGNMDLCKKLGYPPGQVEIFEEFSDSFEKFLKQSNEYFSKVSKEAKFSTIFEAENSYIELFESVSNRNRLNKLSDDEVNHYQNEALIKLENKEVFLGYKDYKNKSDEKWLNDYLIWKEIIKFSQDEQCDILFVTDDIKEWTESEKGKIFPTALIDEFEKTTGNKIRVINELTFIDELEKRFGFLTKESSNYINDLMYKKRYDYFETNSKEIILNVLRDENYIKDNIFMCTDYEEHENFKLHYLTVSRLKPRPRDYLDDMFDIDGVLDVEIHFICNEKSDPSIIEVIVGYYSVVFTLHTDIIQFAKSVKGSKTANFRIENIVAEMWNDDAIGYNSSDKHIRDEYDNLEILKELKS